jgi:FlaA1/EpsC-like NDP-sugar epimerase
MWTILSWINRRIDSRGRRALLLITDLLFAMASLLAALMLRFEGEIPEGWPGKLPPLLGVLVASRLLTNVYFQLHRWSFLLSGLTDGVRVGMAGLLGTGGFIAGVFLLRLPSPPRSVVVMELFLTIGLMLLVRFAPRLVWLYHTDLARARRPDAVRALIFGAGATGEMLLRDLLRSEAHGYQVAGFIDDNPAKLGTIVGGRPTLGTTDDLPGLVRKLDVTVLLIAVRDLPAAKIREILSHCADLKLRFKTVPVSLYQEGATLGRLQDLAPEDLLNRAAVVFGAEDTATVRGRSAAVVGAAGSIGSEICLQLLGAGVNPLLMVDINENGLYLQQRRFERDFPDVQLVSEVADIRDPGRIRRLFDLYRPRDIFHAAAHKHVPLMEQAPCEAVKNNIGGTRNVAAAAAAAGAERFVFISTDKAVRPTSVMGASKRVGEMLVRHLAAHSDTAFSAVRFGNVLDSSGSVVPIFREQIAAGGPVTITHPEVRRYFMTIGEAVGLVLKAAYGNHGPLCILEMGEQIRILDLARHMITLAGRVPEVEIPILISGLRPGEKLAEELMTEEEESAHRIDNKIYVADSPLPVLDFGEKLNALLAAAEREDDPTVFRLLRDLVPRYRREDLPRATPSGGIS